MGGVMVVRLFYWLSILVVGVALGLGALRVLTDRAINESGVKNGPWITNAAYGDKDAPLLLKIGVARRGLLALAKEETIYFTAREDSEGRPLRGECFYYVAGEVPQARWWSFTMYAGDDFLVDNPPDIYSIVPYPNQTDVEFIVGLTPPPDNTQWLPSARGQISITVRMYSPEPSVYEALATTPLPFISRGDCQ